MVSVPLDSASHGMRAPVCSPSIIGDITVVRNSISLPLTPSRGAGHCDHSPLSKFIPQKEVTLSYVMALQGYIVHELRCR